jgi:hypothetical protein
MADRTKELEGRISEIEKELPKLREKAKATAEGPARDAVEAESRALEEELAGCKAELAELRELKGKVKVRTGLRLAHAPSGRSSAGLELRGGYIQVDLKDGVPVSATAEVSDDELRRAGFE